MNARQVHAVLAAGVQNPGLIARWRAEPQLLLGLGIQPESLDLEALWHFAGLTTKVRHNAVRQELPMTFRLMGVAGLEIEIFAAYSAFRASSGCPYAATTAARTHDLGEFLQNWLDVGRTDHALLWDLFRHEQALGLLNTTETSRESPATTRKRALSQRPPTATSVPLVRGRVILHEMRCDPLAVTEALRPTVPALQHTTLGTHRYCYWRRDDSTDISILEVDEFAYYALSFVDGRRSVADLSGQMGGGRRPTRAFIRLLTQLASIGILAFAPARRARPA